MKTEGKEILVEYVLGRLSEDEVARVEQQILREDNVFHELRSVENDLIDDYVNGRLNEMDRQCFEAAFLNSVEAQRRADFARGFAGMLGQWRSEPEEAPQISWWTRLKENLRLSVPAVNWSAAVAVVVMGIVTVWLGIAVRGQQERLRTTEAQLRETQQREQSLRAAAQPQVPALQNRAAPAAVTFALSMLLTRDAAPPTHLAVPVDADIQLNVGMDDEDPLLKYQAAIRTAQGEDVWSQSRIPVIRQSSGKYLPIRLPAGLLMPGSYELQIRTGGSNRSGTIGYSYFDVVR